MSTAPAAEAAAPPPKGKKKLIIMVAVAVLVLGGGGGAAMVLMKKKADPDAEGAEDHGPAKAEHAKPASSKHDPKAVPVFVPLEPFTVNLADRNAERFAQVGVTLEIEDAKLGDQIKNYMPAIRNNILMVIADRTAGELMGREGKAKLAERIRRAASRGLGVEVDELEEEDEEAEDAEAEAKPKAKPKKKKKKVEVSLPIKAVHFSNIIIQ